MHLAKKFSVSGTNIILNYSQMSEPHVVAAIYENHNMSIFLGFSDSSFFLLSRSTTQFL